jgi:hypothetical protein
MQHSPYGALVEGFVIEALRSYAEHVASGDLEDESPGAIISKHTWQNVARDVLRQVEAKYGKRLH